jgi:hypothetical protein
MKDFNPLHGLKYFGVALLGSLIAAAFVSATPNRAEAQAAYGSYVGVGASFGVTSGEGEFEEEDVSAVIAGRYRFVKLPISLRGQALVFTDTNAFVPTVSYDFPINWQTDLYLGAGVVFQDADEGADASPVGNQTSFVLQPGIDYMLPNSRLVLFGNSIIAFDAYREGSGVAASLQGGVGVNLR